MEVKRLISSLRVGLVGLLETKVKASNLGALYLRMFSGWCFSSNNAWNNRGRIIMSWNPAMFDVNIEFCTSQLMHSEVQSKNGRERFKVTFFYGFNEEGNREDLWRNLKDLATGICGPWVMMGDFNDILHGEERIGKKDKTRKSKSFQECVEVCQMEDIKFSGNFYTWNNKQGSDTKVYSKIDRVMGNQQWLQKFISAKVVFMSEGCYDHSPAVLSVYPDLKIGKFPFKYYRMWNKAPGFSEKIEQNWRQERKEEEAQKQYHLIHKAYLSYLHQKAKVHWIKEGDENTSMFHASIRARKATNRIYSVLDMDGNWHDQPTQDNWGIVGDEVSEAVMDFLKTGKLLKELNSTVITLIPKSKCPANLSDYRPISCCNVIYKVTTKLICSRLRMILPDLISQNQSRFVQGRYIAYNIMLCQDLVRHYGRTNARPNCMIKLDLKKAYDTIEWDFIEEMLAAFNFPQDFIHLIMICIRTPRFSLMMNGSMHGFFEAKRGLRQGDPMSPLLSILGMEYLSRIMTQVGRKKDFKFHERCRGLMINHLCFADDVLLFCNGDYKSIYLMLQSLKLFSKTSGLQPSEAKSAIYCSGMDNYEVQRVLDASGFVRSMMPFRYLGIPICAKRLSVAECSGRCLDAIAQWLGWSTKSFRLVALLKAIKRGKYSKFRKQVIATAMAALIYFLWKSRNESYWNKSIPTLHSLAFFGAVMVDWCWCNSMS
ncbi:uncharacterized protein LOC133780570 [Humulus lupulus]|uniref:uncharacterized protein LOC133780570 n=1 Tax=Humulus lupulus TaxID=3486 RepID=UPI002B4124FD|nr:uncharacterized protein LOC133780570 [Humulus lupulus]